MLVACFVSIVIDVGFPLISKSVVLGKVISSNNTKYLVDFSKGLKGYNLVGKPSDYSKVLVEKENCVKDKK